MSSRIQNTRTLRHRLNRASIPTSVRSGQRCFCDQIRQEHSAHLLQLVQVHRGREGSIKKLFMFYFFHSLKYFQLLNSEWLFPEQSDSRTQLVAEERGFRLGGHSASLRPRQPQQ